VTAAATAAAGTTSLTVNPFVNNTGTIDNTKNCIVSIDANAEAGGWTTSASHNVVDSGAFTSLATSNTAGTGNKAYVADFYTASGKSAKPYLKMSFTNVGNNYWSVYGPASMQAVMHTTSLLAPVQMIFGCSTTSDLTDILYSVVRTVVDNATVTSMTLNQWAHGRGDTAPTIPLNFSPGPGVSNNVIYKMAVTKDYCIVWEQSKSNSYTNGYSSVLGGVDSNTHLDWTYGAIMYGGLRETYAWENSINNNPPWTAFTIGHNTKSATSSQDLVASYMTTLNDTGTPSATATIYWTCITEGNPSIISTNVNTYAQSTYVNQGQMTYATSGRSMGITNLPIFQSRDTSANIFTQSFYGPVTDDTTGALVPCAIPITFSRNVSGSWHPGGACRGIYKSLGQPLATMKLYFSEGQTFTVNGDPYMPIVFNETMYLVRFK